MNCITNGNPHPSVIWLKNGQELSVTNFVNEFETDNQKLTITRLIETDNGIYSCRASNIIGNTTKTFKLNVLVPPQIKEQSLTETVRIKEGDVLQLKCDAFGTPVPKVVWEKNDLPLPPRFFHSNGSILRVDNIGKRDAGRYSCIATNKAGSYEKDFSVVVLYPPRQSPEAEELRARPVAYVNKPFTIDCPLTGNPAPQIKWLKNGKEINLVDERNVYIHDDGQKLSLLRARSEDTAVYTCVAENEVGSQLKQFALDVFDAALAVLMDHMDSGIEPRLPVAQIDRLNQQLESAEHNRALLEEQIDSLRERNIELEQQVANSQAQINELNNRMQRNQEEVAAIKHTQIIESNEQIIERNELEASRQNLEEMKTGICSRLQDLETNIQREYIEMEKRLSNKFDEQCHQVKAAIETIVQQTAQHVSGNISQLVCEAVQNSNCGDHQGNNLLQSIKVELEKHKDQQKRVLEEERQRQLITVSSALQSALQHLNSAINNDSNIKDGNIS